MKKRTRKVIDIAQKMGENGYGVTTTQPALFGKPETSAPSQKPKKIIITEDMILSNLGITKFPELQPTNWDNVKTTGKPNTMVPFNND